MPQDGQKSRVWLKRRWKGIFNLLGQRGGNANKSLKWVSLSELKILSFLFISLSWSYFILTAESRNQNVYQNYSAAAKKNLRQLALNLNTYRRRGQGWRIPSLGGKSSPYHRCLSARKMSKLTPCSSFTSAPNWDPLWQNTLDMLGLDTSMGLGLPLGMGMIEEGGVNAATSSGAFGFLWRILWLYNTL